MLQSDTGRTPLETGVRSVETQTIAHAHMRRALCFADFIASVAQRLSCAAQLSAPASSHPRRPVSFPPALLCDRACCVRPPLSMPSVVIVQTNAVCDALLAMLFVPIAMTAALMCLLLVMGRFSDAFLCLLSCVLYRICTREKGQCNFSFGQGRRSRANSRAKARKRPRSTPGCC